MYQTKKPYLYGTGRRKDSVARVRLFTTGTGKITINDRDIDDYFGLETLKLIVRSAAGPDRDLERQVSTSSSTFPAAVFPVRLALSATACARALLQAER